MMTPLEQKIRDLSARVIAVQDTPEYEPALGELREAIREHFSYQRVKASPKSTELI